MLANGPKTERELIDWSVTWFRDHLPAGWEIVFAQPQPDAPDASPHAVIEIRAPNVFSRIAVEARRSLPPRDVERLLGSLGRTLRSLTPNPILIVAPWLSPRTRALLVEENLNYLDQTGNAFIRLDNPALFIETQGSTRDPSPPPQSKTRVRGPKAARLIRTLIDVRPPYGVRELAEASGLAPGYVSRLLDALDQDALVERSRRGRVEEADVVGLLRRWAGTYDVFKTNGLAAFIAPLGASDALTGIARASGSGQTAVTGSFAAVRLAPVAAPALLTVYCEDVDAVARELDLLPTDQGANVVLLRPFDPVAWERTDEQDGVRFVAPSQAAVDCLTGTGRMPAEGEAVIAWMLENESSWRREALTAA